MTEDDLKFIETHAKYGTSPGEVQRLVDEISLLRDPRPGMAWVIFADGRARRYAIDPGAEWFVLHDPKEAYIGGEKYVERTFRRVTAWDKAPTLPEGVIWTSCYIEGEKARP